MNTLKRNKIALKIFLFFLLIISVVSQSCSNYKEVTISSVKNIEVKKITKEGIEADLQIQFSNPNSVGFYVYKSQCEVYFAGNLLGKSKLKNKVKISRSSNETYTFPMKFSVKEVSNISGLLLANSGKFEMKGHVSVGKFLFRKKIPVDINEKIPFKSFGL